MTKIKKIIINSAMVLISLSLAFCLVEVLSYAYSKFKPSHRIRIDRGELTGSDAKIEDWDWLKRDGFDGYKKNISKLERTLEGKAAGDKVWRQLYPEVVDGGTAKSFSGEKKRDIVPLRIYETTLWTRDKSVPIFKAEYSIDDMFRRYDELVVSRKGKKIILMGGSFVFGEGLPVEETLSHQMMKFSAEDIRVYNLSYFGHGPNNILFNLEKSDLNYFGGLEDAHQVVYVLPYFHMERLLGPSYIYSPENDWMLSQPWYDLDESGRVVNRGLLGDKPLGGLYRVLYKTQFSNTFGLSIPNKWGDEHFELLARVIKRMQHLVESKAPKAQFIIGIYPRWGKDDHQILTSKLHQWEIETVDMSDLPLAKLTESKQAIPIDGHPTGLANNIIAQVLLKKLKEIEKKE